MTPYTSPIKARHRSYQLGSRIEPFVLISLLLRRSFSSQIPQKIDFLAQIAPDLGPFHSSGEVNDTLDMSNQSQLGSRIEPSVSISLQTSKSFSSQIPSKSSIQPKLDPIWVHQTLLDRPMTPQISPIKAICQLFQLGSRIEPSVSISLLINWPCYFSGTLKIVN